MRDGGARSCWRVRKPRERTISERRENARISEPRQCTVSESRENARVQSAARARGFLKVALRGYPLISWGIARDALLSSPRESLLRRVSSLSGVLRPSQSSRLPGRDSRRRPRSSRRRRRRARRHGCRPVLDGRRPVLASHPSLNSCVGRHGRRRAKACSGRESGIRSQLVRMRRALGAVRRITCTVRMPSRLPAAYCGLLRLVAAYCGLLRLIAAYCILWERLPEDALSSPAESYIAVIYRGYIW